MGLGGRHGLRAAATAVAALGLAGPGWAAQTPRAAETPPNAGARVPEGVRPPVALPSTAVGAIERAWRMPAASLEERTARTRRAALEHGAWNFDPGARAVAAGAAGGSALERAQEAVRLAPDLPLARFDLARALWLQGDSPMAALRAVIDALAAIPRHVESALWFAGSGLFMLTLALALGGLLAIAVASIAKVPHAAHDLGHLLPGQAPEFARFALLGALLLVPLALGEGLLGLALAGLAVAFVYGSRRQRLALLLAIGAVGVAAYPLGRLAGSTLNAFPADPVARAAFTTAQGMATPVQLARLTDAADRDPLALRGLAIHARQSGNLGEADALYQTLLESEPDDIALLNNAANVRLDLGHMESALDLYARAVEQVDSPLVLFNLSQAYGRAFQVEDLNRTLAHAQSLDGDLVAELTSLQGAKAEGFVVDLPLPPRLLWKRILRSDAGEPIAAELRAPLAPGRLGRDPRALAGTAGAIALLGALLSTRFSPSKWCARCGGRMCSRCRLHSGGALCESCNRLFYHPEQTDRALRLERVNALRERERRLDRVMTVASLVVPGTAGLFARRPLASLIGSVCFTLAAAALVFHGGVVPDPLVAGPTAPLLFVGVAALSGLIYVVVAIRAITARREAR